MGTLRDGYKKVSAAADSLDTSLAPHPRVAIADDDPVVLGHICTLLETQFDVVARVADGRELVEAVRKLHPEIVVTDVAMPGMNGIKATDVISHTCPGVKVVMLSVHDDADYVDAAAEAGASGYVLKLSASRDLIPAIETVLAGGTCWPADTT